MKKLNRKLFIVIYSLLTIFLFSILFIFNYQDYNREYNNVESILNRMDGFNNREPRMNERNEDKDIPEIPKREELESRIYMDSIVYTVTLDDGKVSEVFSHTEEDLIDETNIMEIAEDILKENDNYKINNLYMKGYSYAIKGNVLTIVDNALIRERLFSKLGTSIIIFVLLEVVILIVAKLLTKWLIRPVEETFMKQKQFVEDASHELKTPIAVVLANAEMIESDEKNLKWLENIKSEANRMNKLVIDLLSLARLENEKEELVLVNLGNLVEKAILPFESLMYENNIKLDYELDKEINFKCNQERIKQLIVILLDNAIKHSSKKGSIMVNLTKRKNDIVLEVRNKGKEIPIEERDKIFERFYRGDKARNRNDNRYGLGLAIAKGIVENHDGKIVVSCEDGYTTFKVNFKEK